MFFSNCFLIPGLLVTKIGFQKIAVLALIFYSVRLAGFKLMTSPELFLILEVLKPLCTTLLILSVANFVKSNSTETSTATVQSIFASTHFGVGENQTFLADKKKSVLFVNFH